jgi:hypothetical protein
LVAFFFFPFSLPQLIVSLVRPLLGWSGLGAIGLESSNHLFQGPLIRVLLIKIGFLWGLDRDLLD